MDSQEPTRPEYKEIQEQIMTVLQSDLGNAGGKTEYTSAVTSFTEMIEFLEMMYISTILSMVGSFITTMAESDDKVYIEHLREVIKAVVEAAGISPQATLDEHYPQMIDMLGVPDPLAEKTHNQKVADDIMREMENG